MDNIDYKVFIKKYTPHEDTFKNAVITFLFGGLIGFGSELLLEYYSFLFDIPRKESGILVILTLIVLSSFFTAFGIMDLLVSKLKSALLIPISGFAHSLTSAALEYRKEGFITGLGTNIFKLAGSVILYGIVSVYFFGLIRLLILGG